MEQKNANLDIDEISDNEELNYLALLKMSSFSKIWDTPEEDEYWSDL